MTKAGTGGTALTPPEESERLALSGAQSSCRADRFFVAASAWSLPLDGPLCNCFLDVFIGADFPDKMMVGKNDEEMKACQLVRRAPHIIFFSEHLTQSRRIGEILGSGRYQ